MKVSELMGLLELELIAGKDGIDNEISGGYIGDLLSFVMSHAREKNIWITIQGHINSVAVASLLGISAIVLAEKSEADSEMIKKADEEAIPILRTDKSSFEFVYELGQVLNGLTL